MVSPVAINPSCLVDSLATTRRCLVDPIARIDGKLHNRCGSATRCLFAVTVHATASSLSNANSMLRACSGGHAAGERRAAASACVVDAAPDPYALGLGQSLHDT